MHQPRERETHDHPHPPPPFLQPPACTYTRDYHEEPHSYSSTPLAPSDPTGPVAAMPEPSPIAEHPEHTDSPPPDEPPARQEPTPVPTIRLPKRESTLPPLPTPPADLTVPTVNRVGSAPATPYSATPQPILAPTPGRPRAAMPASSTPVTGPSQPRQGSSSDESPTEDHVFVQRPASQTRPRLESRRNLSSLSHAPHASDGGAPITYPARTLSYNEHRRHRSLRADRPERPSSAASVPAGVGPDRYSAGLSRALTLDYVVPTVDPEKKGSEMGLSNTSEGERTVKQRLMRTLEHAQKERDASKRKAMMSSYALNICIGIQIILGAITTGVAAASTTSRTSTSVGIPILGGLSTLSASYLARARGSGEPELSIVRQHDLDHFIRDTEAFLLDRGHLIGPQYDAEVQRYRIRFEEIMGHMPDKNGTQPKNFGPAPYSPPSTVNGAAPWTGASADGYQFHPPVSPGLAGQPMHQQGQVSPMAHVAQNPLPGQMNHVPTYPQGQVPQTVQMQMPMGQTAPMAYTTYMNGQGLPMPVTMPRV